MTQKTQDKTKKKKGKTTKPAGKAKAPGTLDTGRPSLLTDKVIEDLSSAISIGSSLHLACLYAGISYPTYSNWMRQARAARLKKEAGGELSKSDLNFLKFLTEMEGAEAEAGITWQQVVHRAAKVDANIALQMLRLRFNGYTPISLSYTADFDLTKLTDEQLQRIANGENPADVLAASTAGAGDSGTSAAATGTQPKADSTA